VHRGRVGQTIAFRGLSCFAETETAYSTDKGIASLFVELLKIQKMPQTADASQEVMSWLATWGEALEVGWEGDSEICLGLGWVRKEVKERSEFA
jgi:hypothetical protein